MRNEVRLGLKVAQRLIDEGEVKVVIASNLAHLFRIWMYTMLYTSKSWRVKLVRAHHRFLVMDHLGEVVKVVRDVLYILRVRRRLRRRKKYSATPR